MHIGRHPESTTQQRWHAPVIAVAYPATGDELRELGEAVAPEAAVVDLRLAPRETSLILCRPCSGQAVARLHDDFPGSVVVFLHDDWWLDDGRAGLADEADGHLRAGGPTLLGRTLRTAIRGLGRPEAA